VRYCGGGFSDAAASALESGSAGESSSRGSSDSVHDFAHHRPLKRVGGSNNALSGLGGSTFMQRAASSGQLVSDSSPPMSPRGSSTDLTASEDNLIHPGDVQAAPVTTLRTIIWPQRRFLSRFMLVLTTALSRLAARHQPLTSRVSLSLAKLAASGDTLEPVVAEHAKFCLAMLSLPSTAAAALDSSARTVLTSSSVVHGFDGAAGIYTDSNSSLPFLLRPTEALLTAAEEPIQLHEFLSLDPRSFD
jgi:hypothetical protein